MGSSSSRPSAPVVDAAETSKRSRKNRQSFLVSFLRSVSCGASSSRRDSFIQESPIAPGDSLASHITSEKSAACNGQPGSCHGRSAEHSSNSILADSYQSVPGNGESTDLSLPNGYSSSIVDGTSPSFLGHRRHRYCHKADRQASSILRSERSSTEHTSTDECLSVTDVPCADLSSNQLTSEGDDSNVTLSCRSISGVEDTSGCMPEPDISVNSVEFGRPYVSFQNGSSMEIDASSPQVTFSTTHTDGLGGLQVEASDVDAQTLDNSLSISRGELSGREARRNNGRRLWDALTRASSRRRRLAPSFMLSNEDIDGPRTLNDGWDLFDWNSGEDGSSFPYESNVLSRRSSDMGERRWRARPQVWGLQHFSNSMEGSSGQSRHCAIGRHPNGHCSCETFVTTEESSTRASISRIVMLAEALFEVLDEIHRQSVSLSRSTSLSLVSSPAPEAVVESFAVRIYKKSGTSDAVLGQSAECYICLIEYEEGDQIRVLPCCHGFHKSCVDKWLKEAHRVCPLCRHNVCEEPTRA